MVTRESNSPYKLSGVVSSLPGNQSFREDLAECHNVTAHRQNHSSMLYQSERGHNLQATVPIGYINLDLVLESGNITILSYIVILKCHDNRYRREIFIIVILEAQYYCQYRDYRKIYSSKTFTSVKHFIIYSQFLCL